MVKIKRAEVVDCSAVRPAYSVRLYGENDRWVDSLWRGEDILLAGIVNDEGREDLARALVKAAESDTHDICLYFTLYSEHDPISQTIWLGNAPESLDGAVDEDEDNLVQLFLEYERIIIDYIYITERSEDP